MTAISQPLRAAGRRGSLQSCRLAAATGHDSFEHSSGSHPRSPHGTARARTGSMTIRRHGRLGQEGEGASRHHALSHDRANLVKRT